MIFNRRNIRMIFPTILVFASLIIFQTRDFAETSANPLSLSNAHKVVALSLVLIYFGLYLFNKKLVLNWTGFQLGYLIYILLGVSSSIAFSSNLLFSLWKLSEISAALLLSVYAMYLSKRDLSINVSLFSLSLQFMKFMVVATVVGAIIYPSEAIRSPLSEGMEAVYGTPIFPYQIFGTIIQVNANSLGAMAAIFMFIYTVRILKGSRDTKTFLWLIVSVALLVLSQSRTAIFGLLCAFVISLFVEPRKSGLSKVLIVVVSVLGVIWQIEVIFGYLSRGMDVERLSNLSGRMVWWAAAIEEYLDAGLVQKVIGLGFLTANREILATKLGYGDASSLHSDYIDSLISTGFFGPIILLYIFLQLLVKAFHRARILRTRLSYEMLGIVAILLVRSFTGTTLAVYNIFLIVLLAVAVFIHKYENVSAPLER